MKNRKKIILGSSLILVTILFAFFTFRPQAQNKAQRQQDKIRKRIEQQKSVPQVDYLNQGLVDEKRKRKNEKYNRSSRYIFPEIAEDDEGVAYLDWTNGLTALPVMQSDVVVLGKVADANAYLSANKNTVYSEFKVEIEHIFKSNNQQEIENGKYIRIEREGGIVRYPSGYKLWFHVGGQEMPRIGGRYVFFLTNSFPLYGRQPDLYLITAYELREGQVFPLDNPPDWHPLAFTYTGKSEAILLNDLQNALRPQ